MTSIGENVRYGVVSSTVVLNGMTENRVVKRLHKKDKGGTIALIATRGVESEQFDQHGGKNHGVFIDISGAKGVSEPSQIVFSRVSAGICPDR